MFQPTLIIHGGAGALQRSTLPPDLYSQYHASLLSYLRSTKDLLDKGTPALDAAVHAVSLMEDDELFNCGRGSVFTKSGTIEMEASVMITSVLEGQEGEDGGAFKRAAGVIGLKNVRHPIRLARESLLRTGHDATGTPTADGGSMHSQLAAPYVEELAREWGLEFKPDEWFFTQRRWDEHRRGLEGKEEPVSMSQGTVGCVCLDRWGGLAVATSTGGMTNKFPGRIGDTPTLGAGFWAERWDGGNNKIDVGAPKEMVYRAPSSEGRQHCADSTTNYSLRTLWDDIFGNRTYKPSRETVPRAPSSPWFMCSTNICTITCSSTDIPEEQQALIDRVPHVSSVRKRAIALSGTGNGDSFLRVAAARTACAIARFSPHEVPAAAAVTAIAGPGGELQRSAGPRWQKTGEGEGGIIGIEARVEEGAEDGRVFRGTVVFDFNCGGMWRAWIETGDDGHEVERVMVFREEYH
ncbi:N-terminal nucleophile aminohydrolase [Aspergillus taichungensis]|uniref:N-terminal nucleophile aminohydrolase n=1 Tax=Aspergillus taichungensis TaxID=482145 RepID=A0A2J5HWC6_9EURO|nr:N-terminal nucleophile aminohydrolase [Aspergillus taichungensis]